MSSLAQLPELVGFFSYSREDDEAFRGSLSALRDAIQRELSAQLGRTRRNFCLWQDQEAIAPGKDWEAEITKAVEQSVFFIPIVTPRAAGSEYCKFEAPSCTVLPQLSPLQLRRQGLEFRGNCCPAGGWSTRISWQGWMKPVGGVRRNATEGCSASCYGYPFCVTH